MHPQPSLVSGRRMHCETVSAMLKPHTRHTIMLGSVRSYKFSRDFWISQFELIRVLMPRKMSWLACRRLHSGALCSEEKALLTTRKPL